MHLYPDLYELYHKQRQIKKCIIIFSSETSAYCSAQGLISFLKTTVYCNLERNNLLSHVCIYLAKEVINTQGIFHNERICFLHTF